MSQNQNQIPDKVWADIAAACDRIGQSGEGAVELAQALDRLSNALDPEDVAKVRYELDQHKLALQEWLDKTEWVQETAAGHELGMHRADVLKQRIESLQKQVHSLNAAAPSKPAVPHGWYIAITGSGEVVVRAPSDGPGAMTIPSGSDGALPVRLLDALCRAFLSTT